MTHVGHKDELITDAQRVLGDREPVLHAGAFGLQGFMKQTVGAVPGGQAGKRAAELQPVTMRLIVAVTPAKIHVITWYTGDAPQRVMASFDRATTTAKLKHFGFGRVLALKDSASGAEMNLHASTSRVFAATRPAEEVMNLLIPAA